MSWKTLITARTFEKVGKSALDLLRENDCEAVIPPRFGPWTETEIIRELDGIDAVLCSPDVYSRTVIRSSNAAGLKIISRWGVGYDSIDVPAASEAGIVVAYTPGMLDEAVADYTFALLLSLARPIGIADQNLKAGRWQPRWGIDVFGKTLGIIGYGRIGRAVARRARGFDMRLLINDLADTPSPQKPKREFTSLPRLLEESDIVTLHASLTSDNRGMMDETAFRRMKSGAFFINTARGGHVDETALIRALSEGWIRGAAVDVFSEEPLPPRHPLLSAPNLILTPHQAPNAIETGELISLTAAQAIVDLKHGKAPQTVLNPEVLRSAALRTPIDSQAT